MKVQFGAAPLFSNVKFGNSEPAKKPKADLDALYAQLKEAPQKGADAVAFLNTPKGAALMEQLAAASEDDLFALLGQAVTDQAAAAEGVKIPAELLEASEEELFAKLGEAVQGQSKKAE